MSSARPCERPTNSLSPPRTSTGSRGVLPRGRYPRPIIAVGPIPEPVKGKVAYLGQEDEDTFVAEPGLGVDARFIALIQAKMALLTLLRGQDTTLEDYPADFVLWGNRKEWIFPAPLYAQFANTAFRQDCSACREWKRSTNGEQGGSDNRGSRADRKGKAGIENGGDQ